MHGGHQGAKKSMKYLLSSCITPGKSSGVRARTFDVELSLANTAISWAENLPEKRRSYEKLEKVPIRKLSFSLQIKLENLSTLDHDKIGRFSARVVSDNSFQEPSCIYISNI